MGIPARKPAPRPVNRDNSQTSVFNLPLLFIVWCVLHCHMLITEWLLHALAEKACAEVHEQLQGQPVASADNPGEGELTDRVSKSKASLTAFARMNAVLEKNGINYSLREQGTKVEPVKLDGPRAKKIINCHQELIDAIIPPENLTDRQSFWCESMRDVWRQWAVLDSMFQNSNYCEVMHYNYGKEARRLGLYWVRAFTAQFMGSNYLHIVVFHTEEYWLHLQQFRMTFALFSTTGLERRHVSLGRPAHDKCYSLLEVGRKRKDCSERNHAVPLDLENRVAYLTLR